MRPTTKLRKLLREQKTLVVPGCPDCFSAQIAERVGMSSVYLPGFGISVSRFGLPDIGLATMSEMVESARSMVQSVSLPVISDADTGYGNAINVWRTIREFEKTGVAAVHLEDLAMPKRCSGIPGGGGLISKEEMVGKIKAARDAAQDDDFVIIGRTDAKVFFGIEEAKERLHSYIEAGADLVMPVGKHEVDELREMAKEFPGRLLFCVGIPIQGWDEGFLPVSEYTEMGVKVLVYSLASLFTQAKSVMKLFSMIRDKGHLTREELASIAVTYEQAGELFGLSGWLEREKEFVLG